MHRSVLQAVQLGLIAGLVIGLGYLLRILHKPLDDRWHVRPGPAWNRRLTYEINSILRGKAGKTVIFKNS